MIGYTFNTPLEPITYRNTPDNETCRYGIEFFARFSFFFSFFRTRFGERELKKKKKGERKKEEGATAS